MTARASTPGEPVEGSLRLAVELPSLQYAALVKIGEQRGLTAASLVAQLVGHALHIPGQPAPVRRGRQGRRFTDAELFQMVELKRSGQPVATIAMRLGTTPKTVQLHLQRLAPGTLDRARSVRSAKIAPHSNGARK